MFFNVSHKMQVFAKVFTWIGIVAGALLVLLGIFWGAVTDEVADGKAVAQVGGFTLILYGVLAALFSWFWGLLIHGFAQLIQDTRKIREIAVEKLQSPADFIRN